MLSWLSAHRLSAAALVLGLLVAAGVGGYLVAGRDSEAEPASDAPAPEIFVQEPAAPERSEELGFPAFATKNTTRVAAPDSAAAAAGVALAVWPASGGVPGPDAVTIVDAEEWQAGIAAAALVAAPVGAPILISEDGELGGLGEDALRALDPQGSSATEGSSAFVVGAGAEPEGTDATRVRGESPAELAAEVDRLRTRLAGSPDHVLVTSSEQPAYAMPAAAWAARSGEPVLFTGRDSLPAPTREALERHKDVPAYVLGPERAISEKVVREIDAAAGAVVRVGDEGPVANAIAFARYVDGSFGWDINDPGHGLVIAPAERPLDAAAAAPLSASGTWGPLLVTEDGESLAAELRGYLLDLKPGYEDDPTRAVYNHAWLIGDAATLSVGFQAQVDELLEVAPVRSGSGNAIVPLPGDADAGGDGAEPKEDRGR